MTTQSQPAYGPLQYIDLGVGGMTCDECARTVAEALASVPGVTDADVSLGRRSARVTLEAPVEAQRLTAAVRSTGYNAFVRPGRVV